MPAESPPGTSLTTHLRTLLPDQRTALRDNIIPTILASVAKISTLLRSAHSVSQVGSSNAFGDEQLNVDVLSEQAVRDALAQCSSIVTASSEEDPVERDLSAGRHQQESGKETYTVAFDPLDGSSIIAANWTIGTIIGIWDGSSALHQTPAKRQIAAILGVCGPRTTAIVALRLPEWQRGVCFEVGISDNPTSGHEQLEMKILRPDVTFDSPATVKTRCFAPANLRAAAKDPKYLALVNHYIKDQYTLRYSGGLVPDVVHALTKGHGVYISPVSGESKPKLRKLYELCPVALIVECAGGKAVDAVSGKGILKDEVGDVEERGGLICGNKEEVDFVVRELLG